RKSEQHIDVARRETVARDGMIQRDDAKRRSREHTGEALGDVRKNSNVIGGRKGKGASALVRAKILLWFKDCAEMLDGRRARRRELARTRRRNERASVSHE